MSRFSHSLVVAYVFSKKKKKQIKIRKTLQIHSRYRVFGCSAHCSEFHPMTSFLARATLVWFRNCGKQKLLNFILRCFMHKSRRNKNLLQLKIFLFDFEVSADFYAICQKKIVEKVPKWRDQECDRFRPPTTSWKTFFLSSQNTVSSFKSLTSPNHPLPTVNDFISE